MKGKRHTADPTDYSVRGTLHREMGITKIIPLADRHVGLPEGHPCDAMVPEKFHVRAKPLWDRS